MKCSELRARAVNGEHIGEVAKRWEECGVDIAEIYTNELEMGYIWGDVGNVEAEERELVRVLAIGPTEMQSPHAVTAFGVGFESLDKHVDIVDRKPD